MSQLSLFSAAAREPALADLEGVLAGPGQVVRRGAQARVSVVVAPGRPRGGRRPVSLSGPDRTTSTRSTSTRRRVGRVRTASTDGEGRRRLVIVESPAKARTIAGYLGPDYVVESSIGHIRDLPKSSA